MPLQETGTGSGNRVLRKSNRTGAAVCSGPIQSCPLFLQKERQVRREKTVRSSPRNRRGPRCKTLSEDQDFDLNKVRDHKGTKDTKIFSALCVLCVFVVFPSHSKKI